MFFNGGNRSMAYDSFLYIFVTVGHSHSIKHVHSVTCQCKLVYLDLATVLFFTICSSLFVTLMKVVHWSVENTALLPDDSFYRGTCICRSHSWRGKGSGSRLWLDHSVYRTIWLNKSIHHYDYTLEGRRQGAPRGEKAAHQERLWWYILIVIE
jgi:hypothetical protein